MQRLNAEGNRAYAAADVKAKLDEVIIVHRPNTPEQFAGMIRRAVRQTGAAVKAANIQPE